MLHIILFFVHNIVRLVADIHGNFHLCIPLWWMAKADVRRTTKSVVCLVKITRFCRPTKSPNFVGKDRASSIFDDFVGRLFVYRTTNFVYVAMVIVATEDKY